VNVNLGPVPKMFEDSGGDWQGGLKDTPRFNHQKINVCRLIRIVRCFNSKCCWLNHSCFASETITFHGKKHDLFTGLLVFLMKSQFLLVKSQVFEVHHHFYCLKTPCLLLRIPIFTA